MRIKSIIGATIIIVFIVLVAWKDTGATIYINECLSLTGNLRYEFGLHTAESNPNLPENHDLTLSRFSLQTEWTYQPSNVFKLFANIRLLGDTTSLWDSNLRKYNAFPVDVPQYDWLMMKASEDTFRAEVWELYTDLSLGNLWLRLGKQQIAWGEMIGSRILDIINPLDLSWNMQFEPEEFENIRIPEWTIRGIYQIKQERFSWLADSTIEAFVIPGDVQPNQYADRNAPFFLLNFPPYLKIHEKDNRGEVEYGVRLGAMIGKFYGTLNYLHLYSQDLSLKFKGFAPDPINGIPFFAPGDMTLYSMLLDAKYPSIDVYGASLNYAFDSPLNLVVSFEGKWIPNQPYVDARSPLPAIRDQGTFNYAINFSRPTPLLPASFLHASFATVQLQLTQWIVEGDEEKILGSGNIKVDKDIENLVFFVSQPLMHNLLTPSVQFVYDPDDAYFVKPAVRYIYGDHWYFDVFATFLGGKEKRAGRLGSLDWADSVYGRITFQF